MLALDRAVRHGMDVGVLFNLYHGPTGRVRFHGVRAELIGAQADALEMEVLQKATSETVDFESAFQSGLEELLANGIRGIIFGNIHLADVRAWYEERTTARALDHVEPLWGDPPDALVAEVIEREYRSLVVSVDLAKGDRCWLGKILDTELAAAMAAVPDLDPAGEHGEYHSFVYDGPLFHRPVKIATGVVYEESGHAMVDLLAKRV